ncbi:MAG: 4Fe-4S ferredoxin, partial [Chloroflexota bacterium]
MTLQQPVVQPVHDTRGFTDILLDLARRIGGAVAQALPWPDTRTLLRARAQQLQTVAGGREAAESFEQYWTRLLQQGGWWDPQATVGSPAVGPAPTVAPPSLPAQPVLPAFAGDAQQYPFTLVVFPSHSLLDGRLAHLPWLQATPDPITTAVWRTWVEVNPETAQRLGLHEKDLVVVESPQGRVEVPVYIHPAIPPEVVAMPAGQGH